jgi:protein O-mannosyl-transferase
MKNKKAQQPKPQTDPPPAKRIPFPFLWLGLISFFLYAGSVNHGYTELDDQILIIENAAYNEDVSNMATSFRRGVFSDSSDTYYRPLLLNSFILNYKLSETEARGYHVVNILLHVIAVLLLFALLRSLIKKEQHAFLLALLFAVHPALTQAVSWIPGRNDTMLAVFCFSFMLATLAYLEKKKGTFLVLQFIFLLAAFFTKETTLFIPPAFFVLLLTGTSLKLRERATILLFGTWVIAYILWFAARSAASLENAPIQANQVFTNLFNRAPVLLQYFGKTLLPFNLSVFPMMKETSYVFGIAALLLIAALLYYSKVRNNKLIVGGIAWFVILLMPVLLLPGTINEQDFEQRLYLPIVGVLLALSQTVLFKNMKPSQVFIAVGAVAIVLSIINVNQQQKFKDPVTFWTAAVETTPNSAYATMMLGARIIKTDRAEGETLLNKAYRLDSTQKYINFHIGKMYIDRNAALQAENYFLKELKISGYYESNFHLSRIAFEKQQFDESVKYMETYLTYDPLNQQAINNYLLLLFQKGDLPKARAFIKQKQMEGVVIPQEFINKANGL